MSEVIRTERGWVGHFICGHKCKFRRNTLLEFEDKKIIVSTVGGMWKDEENEMDYIGYDRYFETLAFETEMDGKYIDINASEQVSFKSKWAIDKEELDANFSNIDNIANDMHENVVKEITEKLKGGI